MIRLAPLLLVASVGTAHAGRVVGVLDIRGEGVNEVTLERFEEGLEEGLGGDDELTLAPQVRMKEQLARQRIVWVPGAWAPGVVTIAPGVSTIELVR